MAVEHALGLARRSGSVAKPGGGLFIELGKLGLVGLVREQFFVVVRRKRESRPARARDRPSPHSPGSEGRSRCISAIGPATDLSRKISRSSA